MDFPKYILLCILLLLSAACTPDEPRPAMLAMEAWIDTDGYPVVVLTKALRPGDTPTDISDAVARFAKVTITDGTDTVTLTGGVDYTMLPPYSYRNFDMKGRVGARYTVTATYDGLTISASSRMLQPPAIDSVVFSPVAARDSMLTGRIYFTPAPSAETSYYVAFTRVRNRELRHLPGMLGTVETPPSGGGGVTDPSDGGGASASVRLARGKNVLSDFEPDFRRGDSVDIILARVEPDVYKFWQAYNDAVYFGDNIFVASSLSLPTNVTGGLGIFSARATARRLAIIP